MRSIREETAFTKSFATLVAKYPRASDWWLAWSWRLARDPLTDAYQILGADPPTYMIKSDQFEEYGAPPPVAFLYRFDDQYVDILDIRLD